MKIPKHNLTDDTIEVFNKPKNVYIPLIIGNDTNITVLVNKGEYVHKGSIIGKTKGNYRIPIHSSVSGTVIDFVEKTCLTGEKVKCVLIENDFKEKIEIKEKTTDTYTKEQFLENIKENGIIGMGGSGFPTYVKYDNKIKTLIINAVECEPYLMADYALTLNKCEEILEAIDMIMEINEIEEAIIAIRKQNSKLKDLFDNYIGTYLKIKVVLVNNDYPMGWERTLIKEVKHKEYDKLPIECGIVVSNVSTIYAIYEALRYNKPLIERVITFSGEGLEKPKNILVKIGTQIDEVLETLNVKENTFVVSGGPMMGVKIKTNDLVISAHSTSVLCLEEQPKSVANPCIRCGKCVDVCPAKLSPVLIMDSVNEKDKLIPLRPRDCVECGLCSYVCPAKIAVREYVKKAKKEVL